MVTVSDVVDLMLMLSVNDMLEVGMEELDVKTALPSFYTAVFILGATVIKELSLHVCIISPALCPIFKPVQSVYQLKRR